ncbi:MAG: hypothetical protein U0821_24710 [Chloroflexota bacterium]
MTASLCVLIGAGRLAGGFIAPLLRAAGWDVVLGCRDATVANALNAYGGLWLRTLGPSSHDQWIGGIWAFPLDDPELRRAAARAQLFATAVGPGGLGEVGRRLGPLVRQRLDARTVPVNVIAFENHRRSAELLAAGMFDSEPGLAVEVGSRLGIAGAAAWRSVARRSAGEAGLVYEADETAECYVDAAALIDGAPPLDGSIKGLSPVRPFERYMVEKLWVFNAGHAAAAYLGWRAGHQTIAESMADRDVADAVRATVEECFAAFNSAFPQAPDRSPLAERSVEWVLSKYTAEALSDPVARVGREPRRKLAAGDRFIGPAIAALAAGFQPLAISRSAAAALSFAVPSDPQAMDLQRELTHLEPEEVLATVSTLDPSEELTRLIAECYRQRARALATP